MEQVFAWLVTIIGLAGFWLAGKKLWWAWYVNIANQILWVIFAIITDYYAFLVGTAFYLFVFSKNAYSWTKEHFSKDETPQYFMMACGNISKQWHYACTMNYGHEGDHCYATFAWSGDEGRTPLKGRVKTD